MPEQPTIDNIFDSSSPFYSGRVLQPLPFAAPDEKGMVANKIELSFFGLNERGKALSAAWSELDLTLRPETRERVTAQRIAAR